MSGGWEEGFEARMQPLLARLQAGEDVPPAAWFRLEGYAEAGLAAGAIDADRLAALFQACCRALPGAALDEVGDAREWIGADGSVRLRLRMPRAPVFPGSAG